MGSLRELGILFYKKVFKLLKELISQKPRVTTTHFYSAIVDIFDDFRVALRDKSGSVLLDLDIEGEDLENPKVIVTKYRGTLPQIRELVYGLVNDPDLVTATNAGDVCLPSRRLIADSFLLRGGGEEIQIRPFFFSRLPFTVYFHLLNFILLIAFDPEAFFLGREEKGIEVIEKDLPASGIFIGNRQAVFGNPIGKLQFHLLPARQEFNRNFFFFSFRHSFFFGFNFGRKRPD